MLDKTTYTPGSPAPSTPTISGQTIAKTKSWDPRERAHRAARWKLGLAQVEPTVKLAATVFGVSVPLVNEAIKELEPVALNAIEIYDTAEPEIPVIDST